MPRSPSIQEPLIQVADPKPKENTNPQIVVINANPDKTEKKIRKIEEIKKFKIGKNEQPSELLKYYNYLTYENPELLQKIYERKDNDLVAGLKNAFGKDNKENLSTKVNTGGFEDPINVERLRNELFDAEAKIAEDIRLSEQAALEEKRARQLEKGEKKFQQKIGSFMIETRAKVKAREEEARLKAEEEARLKAEEKKKKAEEAKIKGAEIKQISTEINALNRSIRANNTALKSLDPVADKSAYDKITNEINMMKSKKTKLDNKRKELKS